MMNLSPEQAAFINWCKTGKGSCVLEAVAGSGKTTTLLEAVDVMSGQVAIVAYNKKIAEEIKGKLQKRGVDWKKCEAGTVHSFGFRAYRKQFPNVQVDNFKVSNIATEHFAFPDEKKYIYEPICKLVSLAKQSAIGILRPISDRQAWLDLMDHYDVWDEESEWEEIVDYATTILRKSNTVTDVIDFDDMVYLTVVKKCKFWQYDIVMADEAQDTNAARRCIYNAMLKAGGRLIAVGDSSQAIYGFTGADSESLNIIRKDFNAISMPLSVSFRCPKKVVEFSQQWNPIIQHAENAADGEVRSISIDEIFAEKELNGNSAILCRNTAPLVDLAFKFIRNKIACKIEGRDVGANLKKFAGRWKIKTIESFEKKMTEYLEKERVNLTAKKKEVKLQTLEDTVDTLKVIIDACRAEKKYLVTDIVTYIDNLFADDVNGILTLSTVHKSKGREWKNVYWLDRANTCPSKYARQAWQFEQEKNIMYVAATRALNSLIEVIKPAKASAGKLLPNG